MNAGEALAPPWLLAMKQVALFAFLGMFAAVLLLVALGRAERFRDAARLPLDEGSTGAAGSERHEGTGP